MSLTELTDHIEPLVNFALNPRHVKFLEMDMEVTVVTCDIRHSPTVSKEELLSYITRVVAKHGPRKVVLDRGALKRAIKAARGNFSAHAHVSPESAVRAHLENEKAQNGRWRAIPAIDRVGVSKPATMASIRWMQAITKSCNIRCQTSAVLQWQESWAPAILHNERKMNNACTRFIQTVGKELFDLLDEKKCVRHPKKDEEAKRHRSRQGESHRNVDNKREPKFWTSACRNIIANAFERFAVNI
jgi:hypothetical protein